MAFRNLIDQQSINDGGQPLAKLRKGGPFLGDVESYKKAAAVRSVLGDRPLPDRKNRKPWRVQNIVDGDKALEEIQLEMFAAIPKIPASHRKGPLYKRTANVELPIDYEASLEKERINNQKLHTKQRSRTINYSEVPLRYVDPNRKYPVDFNPSELENKTIKPTLKSQIDQNQELLYRRRFLTDQFQVEPTEKISQTNIVDAERSKQSKGALDLNITTAPNPDVRDQVEEKQRSLKETPVEIIPKTVKDWISFRGLKDSQRNENESQANDVEVDLKKEPSNQSRALKITEVPIKKQEGEVAVTIMPADQHQRPLEKKNRKKVEEENVDLPIDANKTKTIIQGIGTKTNSLKEANEKEIPSLGEPFNKKVLGKITFSNRNIKDQSKIDTNYKDSKVKEIRTMQLKEGRELSTQDSHTNLEIAKSEHILREGMDQSERNVSVNNKIETNYTKLDNKSIRGLVEDEQLITSQNKELNFNSVPQEATILGTMCDRDQPLNSQIPAKQTDHEAPTPKFRDNAKQGDRETIDANKSYQETNVLTMQKNRGLNLRNQRITKPVEPTDLETGGHKGAQKTIIKEKSRNLHPGDQGITISNPIERSEPQIKVMRGISPSSRLLNTKNEILQDPSKQTADPSPIFQRINSAKLPIINSKKNLEEAILIEKHFDLPDR